MGHEYLAQVPFVAYSGGRMAKATNLQRDMPQLLCRTLILDRCPGTFQPRMANYWMYLNSSDNLQHLSMADNFFVSDEDLHVLCELEKLLSLNFSGCAQIEDEGLAVGCFCFPPLLICTRIFVLLQRRAKVQLCLSYANVEIF